MWDARIGEEIFWGDVVKPAVCRVDGVGINQPKGVELGAKNAYLGGYVEGHNIDPLRELWQQRKTSKKRTVNVGYASGLPDGRKKRPKAVEGGEAVLTNSRVQEEDH